MADSTSNPNPPTPLADLWRAHAAAEKPLPAICAAMGTTPDVLLAAASVDPALRRLVRDHAGAANLLLLDAYRALAARAAAAGEAADRARAALDFQRVARTVADFPAAFDAALPEPPPIPEPDPVPETEDDRYCAAPARYRDEHGVPINMQHPACVDAAMDAILDTRRRLESEAKARLQEQQYREQQQREARPRPATPPPGSTNFELYVPDSGPAPEPEPQPEPDPELDVARFRKSFYRWYMRPNHAPHPTPPPPPSGKKVGRDRPRKPWL